MERSPISRPSAPDTPPPTTPCSPTSTSRSAVASTPIVSWIGLVCLRGEEGGEGERVERGKQINCCDSNKWQQNHGLGAEDSLECPSVQQYVLPLCPPASLYPSTFNSSLFLYRVTNCVFIQMERASLGRQRLS